MFKCGKKFYFDFELFGSHFRSHVAEITHLWGEHRKTIRNKCEIYVWPNRKNNKNISNVDVRGGEVRTHIKNNLDLLFVEGSAPDPLHKAFN